MTEIAITVPDGMTRERVLSIIQFAVHRFAGESDVLFREAAADKDCKFFGPDSMEMFHRDARDAEAIISALRVLP